MTSSGRRRTRGCCARSNRHFRGVTKTVCVDADLSRVPSVSATEAAERLGVSRPRVTQMVESGRLMGWRDGRNARVSLDSLNARLAKRGDV